MMLWKVFLLLLFCFAQFFPFCSEPRNVRFREQTEVCERSTFFCGITKTVPILFCGIFSERNFNGNHICTAPSVILIKPILQSVLAYRRIRELSATNMRRAKCVYKASDQTHFAISIGLQKNKRVKRYEYEKGKRRLQSFTYFFHFTITQSFKK